MKPFIKKNMKELDRFSMNTNKKNKFVLIRSKVNNKSNKRTLKLKYKTSNL